MKPVWGHFFSRLRQSCEMTSLVFKSCVNVDADGFRLIYPLSPIVTLLHLLLANHNFFCGAENIEKCFKLLGMIPLRRLSRVMGALFWTRQIVFYRHHYSVLWAPGNLIHSPLVHVNGKFSAELHYFYWMFQNDLRRQYDIVMHPLINVMSPDRTSDVVLAGRLMKTRVPLLGVKQISWSVTLS